VIASSVKPALGVLVVAILGCGTTATAQGPQAPASPSLRELSLEQLGRLEVTSVSKQPSEVWRTPAAITVMTQDDIRRSGATTLPELLRLFGGVQVSRIDSDHWAIGIRGLTSNFSKALLVMIDGRSVYTPLFGGVYWQVQETLLEDVERIEVIRGPGATIWGSNAVNGVINVITRHSRDTNGVLVSAGAGNVDQGRAAIRFGDSFGDTLSYRVHASGALRDAQQAFDGHPFDEWSLGQVGFRADVTRAGGDTVRVQGDVYRGTMGERLRLASFAPPSQMFLEGSDIVSGGNLVAAWEHSLRSGTSLRLQGYFDRTVRNAIHFGETQNTFDVDLLLRTPIGRRHSVSWGAGARNSRSDFTQLHPAVTLTPEDRDQRLASVFAQDEIAVLADQLFLTVGGKLERNTYTGWEVQPSIRALWRVDIQESLWVALTRAVRRPSRIETDLRLTAFAAPSPLTYARLVGSESFEAERLVGFEAGYRRLLSPSFYVDIAAFRNRYDGLSSYGPFGLSVQPQPVPHLLLTSAWENGIDASSDGFEIAPDWRPRPWARLRGSYALLTIDATSRTGAMDAINVGLYEGSVPRHQVQGQASLTLPGRVEVDYVQRFVSRLASHSVPRYVTGDARVGWRIDDRLTVAVAGQNLFSPGHVEFYRDDFPATGIRRSVYVSATWRR
jgi:iron complex outermembrane receptor protein